MTHFEYRINVNNTYSPIYDTNPTDLWSTICVNSDRVNIAVLERRLVTDTSILPMLTDLKDVAVKFKDKVIMHWETVAEI